MSAMRPGPWTLRLRMLMVVTALIFFAFEISGCSKKKEAPATAPAKARSEKAPVVAPHQMPADAGHGVPGIDHFNKGLQLSSHKKYDEAIKEYRLALKARPKSAAAYNNIGFAYYDKKDMDRAIENHGKAVELNPSLANGYFGLALAYEKKGDNTKALANWKEFTKRVDPKSPWHKKAMEHIKELTKNKKQKTH